MEYEKDFDVNNLDILDLERITAKLNSLDLISYTINEVEMGEEYFIELRYFSKKLGKTIIYDEDFSYNSDGEHIELMAQSIWEMEKEIREFESSFAKH